jgi:hypothetical protein
VNQFESVAKEHDFRRAEEAQIKHGALLMAAWGFIDGCNGNVLKSAPEAQCLLAPRFSVGKADSPGELRSPVGTAQGLFKESKSCRKGPKMKGL